MLSVPRHVAVIMDGNGRWAQARHRPRLIGHRAGARAVRRTIDHCLARGVEVLTLFAFSSENWGRPDDEVGGLMRLFMDVLEREVEHLARQGVRLRFIGDDSAFAPALRARMAEAEHAHVMATRMWLVIAANYGGQWDITQAARAVARKVQQGRLDAEDIDEALVGSCMALADLAPVDLCIRTGGDMRISNFLLWQLAYAELWFTPSLWPDVDAAVLDAAFEDFAGRQRRYGLTGAQASLLDRG